MMELMIKTASERPTSQNEQVLSSARKEWHLTFLRSPIRFNASSANPRSLESVQFAVNRLEVKLSVSAFHTDLLFKVSVLVFNLGLSLSYYGCCYRTRTHEGLQPTWHL